MKRPRIKNIVASSDPNRAVQKDGNGRPTKVAFVFFGVKKYYSVPEALHLCAMGFRDCMVDPNTEK